LNGLQFGSSTSTHIGLGVAGATVGQDRFVEDISADNGLLVTMDDDDLVMI
jgi:hypothetical protein